MLGSIQWYCNFLLIFFCQKVYTIRGLGISVKIKISTSKKQYQIIESKRFLLHSLVGAVTEQGGHGKKMASPAQYKSAQISC